MSIPALSSAFGVAMQSAAGTYVDPNTSASGFMWFRTSSLAGGAAPRSITLPSEIGGTLLPGGMVKLGVSGMFGGEFIPRPNSLGAIYKGIMGKSTSQPTGNATNICDATASSTSDIDTAGLLTGTSYTATETKTVPGSARLLLTYTHAGAIPNTNVVINGKDENGVTITGGETVTFAAAAAGTHTAVTTNRFSQVTSVTFPNGVSGDTIKIGTWSGYLHTFTMNSDPADVPYYTVARRAGGSSDGFWELVYDARFETLALNQEALAVLNGTFTMNGIMPIQYNNTTGVSALNAAVDPDASPPFVAPAGGFKLDSDWKTDIYSPESGKRIQVRSMAIQVGTVQDITREFCIGSYYPADVDVIGRVAGVTVALLLRDKELYNKLQYTPSPGSGDVTWTPDIYEVLGNGFEVYMKTGAQIPGAHDGTATVAYYSKMTGQRCEWTVNNITLRSNELISIMATGIISNPYSGEPLTFTLLNNVPSY